jgi:hypothetical protein
MEINRVWAMPNSNTFEIKPIGDLIRKHISGYSIDMFANSNKYATETNDINDEFDTDFHLDALEYLKIKNDFSIDTILFDPPYSPRQVSECYKKLDMTVNMKTTQASFWSNLKIEIGRITKPSGKVITCGWNSGGIGKKYGFEIIEILLVPHGGWHNDTIVTVERRINNTLDAFTG